MLLTGKIAAKEEIVLRPFALFLALRQQEDLVGQEVSSAGRRQAGLGCPKDRVQCQQHAIIGWAVEEFDRADQTAQLFGVPASINPSSTRLMASVASRQRRMGTTLLLVT